MPPPTVNGMKMTSDVPADNVENNVAFFVAGGNVEEDKFVCALLFVLLSDLDGITGVLQIDKIHAP